MCSGLSGGRPSVDKAEHSERLMKRDSEVCWSGMSLSLYKTPLNSKGASVLLNTVVGPLLNYYLIPFPSS